MELKIFHISTLTETSVDHLEKHLGAVPGIERLTIATEHREISIKFDEHLLSLQALLQEMSKAGCSLQDINAAVLL